MIAVARAGLGGSTRNPGRTVVDDGDDLLAVTDALGQGSVSVLGMCAGAGSALAFAARHPGRVRRVVLMAAFAPMTGPGTEIYDDRPRRALRRAWRFPPVGRWFLQRQRRAYLRDPDGHLARARAALPPPDARLANRPAAIRRERAVTDRLMTADLRGVADDWRSLYRWPFDLADVTVPVAIWHGTQDRSAPVAMVRWLHERLPHAEVLVSDDVGHSFAGEDLAQVVRSLTPP